MSNKIKKLQELTIKHNFMFCAVMMDPEICRLFLERALDMQIARVEVNREKSFIYNPDYRSVVLDVYVKDETNTHYDVEMQTVSEKDLPRRARYYHSQVDMEILEAGCEYRDLPNAYVIFICDFDPFGEKKYRYNCATYCKETGKRIEDGRRTVFLSTVGKNPEEVPKELTKFLDFVHAGLEDSEKDWDDTYIQSLQKRVSEIKVSRKMGGAYMRYSALMQDERREGYIEASQSFLLKVLAAKGSITEKSKEKIKNEMDPNILEQWINVAINCTDTEDFAETVKLK